MSPTLIKPPKDWKNHIGKELRPMSVYSLTINIILDVVGFYFLDLASDYKPADDLSKFLSVGPPPVYIGCDLIGHKP